MNKTLRKTMISTIAMLVVAVMSLTGVTYAWFTQGTYSEVNGLTVHVESATGGIFIAGTSNYVENSMPQASAYTQSLDLNAEFGGDAGVKPVSTVGGASSFSFFTAELQSPTTITSAENTDAGNVYIHYLYLRNDNTAEDMTINLGGNVSGDTTTPATAITANTSNADGKTIQNAGRIGLRYVATKTLEGNAATSSGSVNNTANYGIFANSTNSYYGVSKASETAFEKDSAGGNVTQVTPTATTEWEILVPKSSIVVIELFVWVEGQDPACVNSNAGAAFDVTLYFDRAN